VLDEVGARVHLKNIHVPKHIEDLEKKIEELKEQKNQAVKNQQYEKPLICAIKNPNWSVSWSLPKYSGKKKPKPSAIRS
jgi:ATP-dependent Clp protease ATP-binding subunit ClpA